MGLTSYVVEAVAQLAWAGDPDGPANGADPINGPRISSGNPSWLTGTTGAISTVNHYSQNPSNASHMLVIGGLPLELRVFLVIIIMVLGLSIMHITLVFNSIVVQIQLQVLVLTFIPLH